MRNFIISVALLWFFFSILPADESIREFQEKNPLRPLWASRTLIINENDPQRIISIKGETLVFIRGNIIEVTIKEIPRHNSTESTDEDN